MNKFRAPVKIRHTGTTAAGEPVWAMSLKDASDRIVHVTRVYLMISFDGTAATSTSAWVLERFDTAIMTGGVSMTPTAVSSGAGAAHVADVRDILAGTGLTDTGVANLEELAIFGIPRTPTGQAAIFDMKDVCYLRNLGGDLDGEGLSITLDDTAVVGDGLRGYVEWEEFVAAGYST